VPNELEEDGKGEKMGEETMEEDEKVLFINLKRKA